MKIKDQNIIKILIKQKKLDKNIKLIAIRQK